MFISQRSQPVSGLANGTTAAPNFSVKPVPVFWFLAGASDGSYYVALYVTDFRATLE